MSEQRPLPLRLLRTPLSELLRGRVAPRLSVDMLLEETDLPQSLRELIQRTVRAARLWRSERVDVAGELASHFADGLASGKNAEQLIENFGDAHAAAKLIRRGKKRNRPLPWRIMRRTLQTMTGVFALMVILYALAAARLYTAEPSVTIDYLAQLTEQARSVSEQDRAWPHYRSAMIAIRAEGDALDHLSPHAEPDSEDWLETAALVQRQFDALAQIRHASTFAGLGFVAEHRINAEDKELWPELWLEQPPALDEEMNDLLGESVLGVLLPYLSEMRRAALCLMAEARIAIEQHNTALAIDDIEAALRMAQHCRETPTLISELVAIAIDHLTIESLGSALRDHPGAFSRDDLVRLAHIYGAINNADLVTKALAAERMFFLDIAQRLYTDDGEGDGRFTGNALQGLQSLNGAAPDDVIINRIAAPAYSMLAPTRREITEQNETLFHFAMQRASTPMWTWEPQTFDEYFEELLGGYKTTSNLSLLYVLTPAMDNIVESRHWLTQERNAILVAIALVLFEQDNGHWPESLTDIPQSILPAIPRDVLTGEPLRYAIIDGAPTIYSVGVDRIDDGASPAHDRFDKPDDRLARDWIHESRLAERENLPTGDWILWRGPAIK